MAVEFVTPATSIGLDMFLALFESARPINPQLRYVDPTKQGYIVLDVNDERVQGAWYLYDDISMPGGATEAFGAAWSVKSGERRLNDDGEAAPTPTNAPDLAP